MTSSFELIDDLDRQWSGGVPPDLPSLLDRVPSGEDWLKEELCAADLEWRWRLHAKLRSEKVIGGLAARPGADSYRSLLGDRFGDCECRRNLLNAEWNARSLWGDEPDLDEFAKQMPDHADWGERLQLQLYHVDPLLAVLTGRQLGEPISIRIGRDFVIGRQASGEPEAPTWIEESGRLILANAHYRVMSRNQLRIRRTRCSEVELTNLSQMIGGRFGKHQIGPMENARISLPFSVTVGEISIKLDRRVHSLDLNE